MLAMALILAYRFAHGHAPGLDFLAPIALAGLGVVASIAVLAKAGGTPKSSASGQTPTSLGQGFDGPLELIRNPPPEPADSSVPELLEKLRLLESRNIELERAWRRAEARIEIKTRFLAQMSHEMRTPMNGIIGFAELLAQTPLAEHQLEKLRLIERSAKRLLVFTNEILDLAKVEAEKFSLKPEFFPLRTYLEDTVALIGPKAKVPIVLCVDPHIPDLFFGDPIRLQQVLANLLGNAVKFTRSGKIAVRVRSLPRMASRLLFSVSDTGPGIADEHLGELFSPFSQLGEYAENGEQGAGLGLNIAMTIVERMGGKIGIASKPGKGSTFWFTHPLAAEMPSEPRIKTLKLALIDEDPLSRKALRYQLESLGARVACFASLDEFSRGYRTVSHGATVLVNAQCSMMPARALAECVEQAKALGARPILLLPHSSRRTREYYRAKGTACLWHPIRNEMLSDILSSDPAMSMPLPSKTPLAAGSVLLRGKLFLVVDDNEINRRLLESRLSAMGARVEEAGNGMSALACLRARPFDMVFLDLRMPEMNGLDILRELLLGEISPNHNTPFIAVTAHLEDEQRVSIAQAGFADFLIKPVPEEALSRVLVKYLKIEPLGRSSLPAPEPFVGYAAVFLEKCGGNRFLAQTLARKLVRELPEHSQEIRKALLDGDLAKAREFTHRINGSAAFCGLRVIRNGAAALEQALLQSPPPASLDRQVRRLDQEIARFLDERDKLFSALGSTENALTMLG